MGRTTRTLKTAARTASKVVFAAADPFFGVFPGPRILIYHQIDAGLGRQMEVTKAAFVSQLDWMDANGVVVDLDAALAARSTAHAERRFVITFDDGYDDFYRHGYPELVKRSMPFVLYLTTQPVDTGVPLFPGGRAEPLTWDQVGEMLTSGLMTLGAHTHTHLDFRTAGTEQIEHELGTSDELIRTRTGVTPHHFAYPWGYWSQAGDAAVRSRYATATVGTGAPITADSDPMLLNRVAVQRGDGVVFFTRKMRTGMRLEDVVRRRLAHYTGP